MVDIPALRKVVDYALSLPTFGDKAPELGEASARAEAIWDQSDWLRVSIENDGSVYYYHADECTITERGLVTSTGHKCGTAACIAGWTALLLAPDGTKVDGEWLTLPDDTRLSIEYWAQERLELTSFDAEELFEGSNAHEDVMRITLRIIAEAEEEAAS